MPFFPNLSYVSCSASLHSISSFSCFFDFFASSFTFPPWLNKLIVNWMHSNTRGCSNRTATILKDIYILRWHWLNFCVPKDIIGDTLADDPQIRFCPFLIEQIHVKWLIWIAKKPRKDAKSFLLTTTRLLDVMHVTLPVELFWIRLLLREFILKLEEIAHRPSFSLYHTKAFLLQTVARYLMVGYLQMTCGDWLTFGFAKQFSQAETENTILLTWIAVNGH